ncbi:MAG: HopJ type III effector protein [Gammaproteobacteria bacterium]
MTLSSFIGKITHNEPVDFYETLAIITENYHYHPTEFRNGLPDDRIVNKAGVNEGSCKIFAFARLHQLNQQQTLNLFGDYYRQDVLNDPEGSGHRNIRHFMKYGWEGIEFQGEALTAK